MHSRCLSRPSVFKGFFLCFLLPVRVVFTLLVVLLCVLGSAAHAQPDRHYVNYGGG